MIFWAVLDELLPGGQGRSSFPSPQCWWGHTWSTVATSGLPSTRESWTYWKESGKGPQRWWREWSISCIRKGWKSWHSAWRRAGSEGSYPQKEDADRHHSVVSGGRTRGSRCDLKNRRFCLNIRKQCFTVSVTDPLIQVVWKSNESSSLGYSKGVWVWSCVTGSGWQRGRLHQLTFRHPLPSSFSL